MYSHPVYLLNSALNIAIAVMCFVLFASCKRRNLGIPALISGVLSLIYFILSLLHLMWFSNFITPALFDFILVDSLFIVARTTLLLAIIYDFTKNRRLFYLLMFFVLTVVLVQFLFEDFFIYMTLSSHLLALLVFFEALLFKDIHLRKAAVSGLLSSLISMFIIFLELLRFTPPRLATLIPGAFIFLVVFYFYKHVNEHPLSVSYVEKYEKSRFFSCIKYFLFIAVICTFSFFSIVAVHELGHAVVAQWYGCEKVKSVIYEQGYFPHSEMVCEKPYNDTAITSAGFAATLLAGILFLILGQGFIREFSLLVIGIGTIIAYDDFLKLGMSKSLIFLAMAIASLLVIFFIARVGTAYLGGVRKIIKLRFSINFNK